jgi:hypothetical protein
VSSLIAALLLAGPPPAPATSLAAPASLAGDWVLEGGDLVIRISEGPDSAAGVVLNGPEKLRGRPFLRDLVRGPDGGWRGELFAPRQEAFVPVTARLEDGVLKMKAGSGLRSRELTWRRQTARSDQ